MPKQITDVFYEYDEDGNPTGKPTFNYAENYTAGDQLLEGRNAMQSIPGQLSQASAFTNQLNSGNKKAYRKHLEEQYRQMMLGNIYKGQQKTQKDISGNQHEQYMAMLETQKELAELDAETRREILASLSETLGGMFEGMGGLFGGMGSGGGNISISHKDGSGKRIGGGELDPGGEVATPLSEQPSPPGWPRPGGPRPGGPINF